MHSLENLAELFNRFPGIGPRQSKRFVYFLLATPRGYREELARLLLELKNAATPCARCQRFFTAGKGTRLCSICLDENRDPATLMIVEKDVDLETIERSHAYQGTYFVLGGTVPILEKNPADRIRLKELQKHLEERLQNGLKELVLALSLTAEGEHTAEHVQEFLRPLAEKGLKISMLGRGLSTGSELEYADPETIRNALKNRQ